MIETLSPSFWWHVTLSGRIGHETNGLISQGSKKVKHRTKPKTAF
jgi:hypothetical protein